MNYFSTKTSSPRKRGSIIEWIPTSLRSSSFAKFASQICFACVGMTAGLLCFSAIPIRAETVIKFATLAPEGSAWMKIMREWNKELMEKTGGQLKFKIYSGGVSGDEKDVVRKIRLGQLQSGGFTGVGLGEIAPEVRVLDAPFLFRNTEEIDTIYKTFQKDWDSAFQRKGYVLLGWAEVGFVYFFTNVPVRNLKDLKGVKMWMWEGDPIAESAFKTIGINPIPLSITDVMTSLQTGLINGVYSSPLAILALQWFTKTKYMYDYHLANASGAVLLSKSSFDKMPGDQQTLLLSTGQKYLSRLTTLSREENKSAIETLRKNGIKIVSPQSDQEIAEYEALGVKARHMMEGRLYSQELLDKVENGLVNFRAKSKSK